jgi:prepilin-type processing-associated H-X9-DG protein
LVELLVVIAIIAVLMGILLPALRKIKEQAKGSVCMSNLRQIGFAAGFYADNWDLYVPRGMGNYPPWFELFMPFLAQKPVNGDYRSVKAFRCPSYPDKEQTVCYVVSSWLFAGQNGTVNQLEMDEPTKLTECRRPAGTIYIADNENGPWREIITGSGSTALGRCDVWTPSHLPLSDDKDITTGRRIARSRHGNGCNVLYFDWHVEWMAAKNMTVNMWTDKK